jgi:hypothetical protein
VKEWRGKREGMRMGGRGDGDGRVRERWLKGEGPVREEWVKGEGRVSEE